jgi:putative transposase
VKRRYPSDLTDEEYNLIKHLIPEAKYGGRPRTTDPREILNAIFYCLKTGCQWRMLPVHFPAWGTVYYYFRKWEDTGLFTKALRELYIKERNRNNKAAPQIGIIDSQTIKSTEVKQPKGFDGNKKNQGS